MPMKNPRALLFAAGPLLALFLPALAGPAVAATVQDKPSAPVPPKAAPMSLEDMERSIFEAVNRERAARNLPTLALSPALTELARGQSREMAGLGELVHESASGRSYSERLEAANVLYAANAENVARGDSSDPRMIHDALMESGGHRANILHPDFDQLGVGIVRAEDGVFYVTQDFIKGVVLRDEEGARAMLLAALGKARRGQGLSPLAPMDDLHKTAQSFARLKSEGKALPVVPEAYGETRVDLFTGPDLDGIAAALSERPLDRYGLVGVGVRFARTAGQSGGAYFVCVFLLVGDPALLLIEKERVAEVLEALNNVRARRKAAPLAFDDVLSREAHDIGRRYGKSRAGETLPAGHGVAAVYETAILGQVPPTLHGHVANTAYRKVGISVRPAGAGLNVNFVVVLLLKD
jgi:uncharacterized protein YkwD